MCLDLVTTNDSVKLLSLLVNNEQGREQSQLISCDESRVILFLHHDQMIVSKLGVEPVGDVSLGV